MTTYSKSGSFGWAGGGKAGAIVDLWATSRFFGQPAENEAPPSGNPDAGPVTTGENFGNPGAYIITGIEVLQDYYVRVQYGGNTYWGACPSATLGGVAAGFQGPQGNQGYQGVAGGGPQGFQGAQGSQGNQGFQGAQGPQGFQGFQGTQGNQGNQGFQGPSFPTGAWTAFTPSWAASGSAPSIGNGALVGFYNKIGRQVAVRMTLQSGSTTNYGTGTYALGLPFESAATGLQLLPGYWNDGTDGWAGTGVISSSSTSFLPYTLDGGTSASLELWSASQFIGTGQNISFEGTYESLT